MKKVYEYRWENADGEDFAMVSIPEQFDPDSWIAGYVAAHEETSVIIDCVIPRPDLRSYQVHHKVDFGDGEHWPRIWRFYASSEDSLEKQLKEFGSRSRSVVKEITKVVPE